MPGCKRPVAKISVSPVPNSLIQIRRRGRSEGPPAVRENPPAALEPVHRAAVQPRSRDSAPLPSFTPPPRRRARRHSPERTNATFDHTARGYIYATSSNGQRKVKISISGSITVSSDSSSRPVLVIYP
ncbi:hypothetical protein Ddc_12189 [Ditylenchus destructor]|nr:hypothetical protein Ddc_12189 [Ditylenchus destructor]